MLVEVFCLNRIAARGGISGKRHIPFMVRVVGSAGSAMTAVLDLRSFWEMPAGPSWLISHCYFSAPPRQAAVDLQPSQIR